MNMITKKRSSNHWCKMHSPDRERNRLVSIPSTMQKHELEDVYYKLLNNNLELKKTVNEQEIEIKLLTTKVRRMTGAHRSYLLKDPKDCCENSRNIIEGLNKYIEELQTTIEHKNERIRSQNMKLCSTKQFLAKHNIARSSLQANLINSPYSVKHHTSVAHSAVSTRSHAKSHKPSSQSDLQGKQSMDAETYTEELERTDREHHCANNKCTTVKGELNVKIYELHEQLMKINDEYKTRIADLELTTQQLRTDVSKERAEKNLDVKKHIEIERDRRLLREELNVIEAKYADLRTQLVMEQKKVFELEMQLKSAELSNDVAKTIEMHFANRNKIIEPIRHDKYTRPLHDTAHAPSTPEGNKMVAASDTTLSPISPSYSHILVKSNDDSGFTDQEVDDKMVKNYANNVNLDLQKTINDLQNELRELKLSRSANEIYLTRANRIDSEHRHAKESLAKENNNELIVTPKRDLEDVVNNVNMNLQSVAVIQEELKAYSKNDLQPKIINFEQCHRGEDNSDAMITHSKKDLNDSTVILDTVNDEAVKDDDDTLEHCESNTNEPIASSPILQQNITHIGVTKDINVRVSVTDRKRSRRKKSKHRVSNKQAPSNSNNIDKVDDEGVKANTTKESNVIKMVDQRCTESKVETVVPPERSPARSQHTYVVSARVQRPASPNDTEYEISSIVETPPGKTRRRPRHVSPGEKLRSRHTSSSTSCDTSSYLSDGEVRESSLTPTNEKVSSIGETKDDRQIKTTEIGYQPIKARMDDALQSISTELVRCRQLLRAKSQSNGVR